MYVVLGYLVGIFMIVNNCVNPNSMQNLTAGWVVAGLTLGISVMFTVVLLREERNK